ncbi:hypothetical protein CC79DRAFT_1317417 [Sarocladium strictum]
MKIPTVIIGLLSAQVLGNPVDGSRVALRGECGELGVMDWDLTVLPEGTDVSVLRRCKEHPSEIGVTSHLLSPEASPEDLDSSYGKREVLGTSPNEERDLDKRYSCPAGSGRGKGQFEYDYGCDKGWCWRNCDVNVGSPGGGEGLRKPWCWLAYEGGHGGWTPCGRWQDCEWSYNNKNAKCGKGDCKACGCGC